MQIKVLKFGGTSLIDDERRLAAIQHIMNEQQKGYKTVVVVSAIGRKGMPYATDTLLSLVDRAGSKVTLRERNLLISCGEIISAVMLCSVMSASNLEAKVFTGPQAGIYTNGHYGRAEIIRIDKSNIINALENNLVPIICGFQGSSSIGDITTLGRGGSDTSAVAIGATLDAEEVVIYTDVSGVLTADPRWVKKARILKQISYYDMCQLAHLGSKVIHPRAVEWAMKSNVRLRVKSTFSNDPGTNVVPMIRLEDDKFLPTVTGIACRIGLVQLKFEVDPEDYYFSSKIFKILTQNHITIDFVQSNAESVQLTIHKQDFELARSVLIEHHIVHQTIHNCAKLSLIGPTIHESGLVTSEIIETLMANDVPILQISTASKSVWILLQEENLEIAANLLHETFDLHNS